MRILTWKDIDETREYYVDDKLFITIDLDKLTDDIHYDLVNEFLGI